MAKYVLPGRSRYLFCGIGGSKVSFRCCHVHSSEYLANGGTESTSRCNELHLHCDVNVCHSAKLPCVFCPRTARDDHGNKSRAGCRSSCCVSCCGSCRSAFGARSAASSSHFKHTNGGGTHSTRKKSAAEGQSPPPPRLHADQIKGSSPFERYVPPLFSADCGQKPWAVLNPNSSCSQMMFRVHAHHRHM